MARDALKAKIQEMVEAVQQYDDWDAETAQPFLKEVEFDDVWKLVVVRDEGFQTIKIHRRTSGPLQPRGAVKASAGQ